MINGVEKVGMNTGCRNPAEDNHRQAYGYATEHTYTRALLTFYFVYPELAIKKSTQVKKKPHQKKGKRNTGQLFLGRLRWISFLLG